jgi:hypothetical protein
MRFQEPQLLVKGARKRDQQIVGIGIARLAGRVDTLQIGYEGNSK